MSSDVPGDESADSPGPDPARRPHGRSVRDGIIAVTVGSVLAAGFMVGVRGVSGGAERAEPVTQQSATPLDACHVQESGGGESAAESPPVAGPDFPRQDHDLDTGRPVRVQGSGNAEVAYHRMSEFATVVGFECANCTGDLTVFNLGAAMPIVSGETIGEEVAIEWLIDTVHEPTPTTDNSLLVRADGDWTLTLRSWHDLPVQTGRVDGRGSQVIRTEAPRVRVSFAPLNSRDTLNVYSYRLRDREFRANECIGRFESRVVHLNDGEVLLVWARGEWSVEPD